MLASSTSSSEPEPRRKAENLPPKYKYKRRSEVSQIGCFMGVGDPKDEKIAIHTLDLYYLLCELFKIRHPKYITNLTFSAAEVEQILANDRLSAYHRENHLLFVWEKEGGIQSIYYLADRIESVILPHESGWVVCELLEKKEKAALLVSHLQKRGFALRDSYFRMHLKVEDLPTTLKKNHEVTLSEELSLGDEERIYILLSEAFDPISDGLPSRERFGVYLRGYHLILAKVEGRVAGLLLYTVGKKNSLVEYVVVDREYLNRAIATTLFDLYFKRISERCRTSELWVNTKNQTTALFYEKLNYVKDPVKKLVLIKSQDHEEECAQNAS